MGGNTTWATGLDVIREQIQCYFDYYYNFDDLTRSHAWMAWLTVAVDLFSFIVLIIKRKSTVFGYAAIQILPLLWYCMAKNHSIVHGFMTCRLLIASMACIGCMFYDAIVTLVSSAKPQVE